MTEEGATKPSFHTVVFRSIRRTHDMFLSDYTNPIEFDDKALKIKKSTRIRDDYGSIMNMPRENIGGAAQRLNENNRQQVDEESSVDTERDETARVESIGEEDDDLSTSTSGVERTSIQSQSLLPTLHSTLASNDQSKQSTSKSVVLFSNNDNTKTLAQKRALITMPKPQWHAPWKLYRVISGHLGWVRCIDVEPGNEWFATGSGDRLIKIWDLASGQLKLSLTGHVSAVRGVAISTRHPYLFSCGEDKQVKCWDLETNKVIRHYHGHLSACYGIALHPTLDVLVSCGRDSVARVWDMRSKIQIHSLEGHTNTVAAVKCQEVDPQIITCSHDSTIRCWDIVAGKTIVTLTNHKKSVRSIVLHPKWSTFASASPDNIKEWKLPKAEFVQNLSGHNSIVNSLAVNSDNVLVSAADNGSMYFWDWITGYNFQRLQTAPQPGSIDSEMGIYAMAFDQSGSRLITCEADKTIKIYKEDEDASEETHPINWKPDILKRKRF